ELEFSPDGRFLLGRYTFDINQEAPEDPRSLALWETETGKGLWTKGGKGLRIGVVAFAPDGRQVLVQSGDKVEVWAVPSGEVVRTFLGNGREVWNMAFAPDGKKVLVAMMDGRLRLLEFPGGKELSVLEGPKGGCVRLTFSGNGKLVLACSTPNIEDEGTVWLW